MAPKNTSKSYLPIELQNKLPRDSDAEMALLGSILISGKYAYELVDDIGDKLRADYFFDPKNQSVYEAITALWLEQQPIDTIHLSDYLRKNPSPVNNEILDTDYLQQLIAKCSLLSSPADTVKLIKEKYILRSIISIGEEMKIMGFNQDSLPEHILDQAQQKLFKITLGNTDKNFVHIKDVALGAMDNLSLLSSDSQVFNGIHTDFIELDKMLGGGFHNSDLVILACRPSMGKTALSLALARKAAKKDVGVAYFSLEMSADQLFERMLASESGIDFRKIRTGDLSGDEKNREFEAIGSAISRIAEWPIWVDDTAAASVLEIRSKARRLKQRNNIGLIIIDYLQLMSGGNDRAYAGNRVQEVSDISRNLKILAKDLNVPILALSQLSRKVENRDDKRPMLSDLRESGSIEQDADIVMFLHREDYYDKTLAGDPNRGGKAEIIVAKNRNGETGGAQVAWIRHLATFDNLLDAKYGSKFVNK